MKKLLVVTAIFEGITGVSLITFPTTVVTALLGAESLNVIAVTVARITGAAILSLAAACWFFRENENNTDMVKTMIIYNIGAISILLHSKLALDLRGIGLLPTIFSHLILLAWCIVVTHRRKPIQP